MASADFLQFVVTVHFFPRIRLLKCICKTSPGTHTFFPSFTCRIYRKQSVQLLGFDLFCSLTLACGLIYDFCSSGQRFAHWEIF